jgi:hypothetical protein
VCNNRVVFVGLVCLLTSCGGSGDDPESLAGVPSGHVLFHFKMISDGGELEDFRAATDDPEVIAEARLQLITPIQERTLFVAGAIDRGNGGHNLNWNWHFIPSEWAWTEAVIEICDSSPLLIEQAIDYWVDAVGQLCVPGSYVAEEIGRAP